MFIDCNSSNLSIQLLYNVELSDISLSMANNSSTIFLYDLNCSSICNAIRCVNPAGKFKSALILQEYSIGVTHELYSFHTHVSTNLAPLNVISIFSGTNSCSS